MGDVTRNIAIFNAKLNCHVYLLGSGEGILGYNIKEAGGTKEFFGFEICDLRAFLG